MVEACLERARYACEINGCQIHGGRGEGWSWQHRLPRQIGGTSDPRVNRPSNGLIVCGSSTSAGGCHQLLETQRRAEAYIVGWLIHRCACHRLDCDHAPVNVPALILREQFMYLTDRGTYADHAPGVSG